LDIASPPATQIRRRNEGEKFTKVLLLELDDWGSANLKNNTTTYREERERWARTHVAKTPRQEVRRYRFEKLREAIFEEEGDCK